ARERTPPLLQPQLSARHPLRAQLWVSHRDVVPNAEEPVELVERRHAVALVDRRAQIGGGGRAEERGAAWAREKPLAVAERLPGGHAGRRPRGRPVPLVVRPAVTACAAPPR